MIELSSFISRPYGQIYDEARTLPKFTADEQAVARKVRHHVGVTKLLARTQSTGDGRGNNRMMGPSFALAQ